MKVDGPKNWRFVPDRPLWLKWPSGLAQDRPLLDKPSTFARPSTLRTVHFHPFGLSTLDQTRFFLRIQFAFWQTIKSLWFVLFMILTVSFNFNHLHFHWIGCTDRYCNSDFIFIIDFDDLMGFERFYIFELLLSNGTSTVIIVQYLVSVSYQIISMSRVSNEKPLADLSGCS